MLELVAPEEFRAMRETFVRADYTERRVLETLGSHQLSSPAGPIIPHLLGLTRGNRPVDVLFRLFLLGASAAVEEARRALEPAPLEVWQRSGLIEVRDGSALSPVRVMAYQELLLACDPPAKLAPSVGPDLVIGLTNATFAVADFMVRQPARRALDVGTGCGALAFLAAAQSEQVWAVDQSTRAARYAEFNAALNGIPNVTVGEGDAFEPVRGLTFDLIVSNPPFAITPGRRYLYRDGGLEADGFCRMLARRAPEFLGEGGFFQFAGDWAHVVGQDWKERLAGWFEGTGCDVWVISLAVQPAATYAYNWIRDTEPEAPEAVARLYQEWVAYFERERIEAVGSGLVAMRRRSGRNWLRIEEIHEEPSGLLGGQILRGFAARDFLETTPEDGLLGTRLRVSPEVRLEKELRWAEGKWEVAEARLHIAGGLRYTGRVDQNAVELVTRCDGRRPLREVIRETAATLGTAPERVAAACLPLVRQLIEHGFLLAE